MTPRKKPTATLLRRNCDDRVRAIVVARGKCARCGITEGPFEAAHIVRRRYSHTRTDERNIWCLCPLDHRFVDTDLIAFNRLVETTIGWEMYEELLMKSKRREKFDWASELVRLKALKP